jgi:hypothetical protein
MNLRLILAVFLSCLTMTHQVWADGIDLPALTSAIKQMCVQPDKKRSYLKIEGDLSAGATLKVVGVNGGAKVTKEDWDGINQRIDRYKTDPRECAIETLKILVPLYSKPHTGLSVKDTQNILVAAISELANGQVDDSKYTPTLRQQIVSQMPMARQQLLSAGTSKAVKYISTETAPGGIEILHFADYRQNRTLQWDISTDTDGTILGLYFRQVP